MRVRAIGATALVILGATAATPGQQPPSLGPGGTFRSSTALVEVDVVVQDGDGRFVPGLGADDFEVFEDGRPQRISHLYLVSPDGAASDGRGTAERERRARRVFVLVFDSEHISAARFGAVKQAALQFVREQFGPGDLGGVYSNRILYGGHLTTDRQELLDGVLDAAPAVDTAGTRRGQLVEYPRIESEEDAARIEAGDRRLLESIADLNCTRERDACDFEGGREYVVAKLQRKAQLYLDESRRAAAATVNGLAYLARNLSSLPGRKTIVMLSEGFYVQDTLERLRLVTGSAARAGVTIYTLDTRGSAGAGTRTLPDAAMGTGSLTLAGDSGEDGLDVLARQTGGLAVRHTDDFELALRRIADDTSTYYVLAYSPEHAEMDGTFRAIELKTRWKGLSLRARRGYVATPLPPPRPLRTGSR